MSPTPREIVLECAEVTGQRIDFMDDAALFGIELQRSGDLDLRACAGQLPSKSPEQPQ